MEHLDILIAIKTKIIILFVDGFVEYNYDLINEKMGNLNFSYDFLS